MSKLSPKEFESLANRIEAGVATTESERNLIVYALRSIASQSKQVDTYGLALMMIRAGAADPIKVAREALS